MLRDRRLALGLTQEDLADRAGVSRSAVQDAERGEPVRVSTAKKLASVLQISWTCFYAEDSSNRKQMSADETA